MKIQLNYTPEELSMVLDGLNNAIFAVQDVYHAAVLGCQIPLKFEPLFNGKSFEEVDALTKMRFEAVLQLYKFLSNYES